MLKLVVCLIEVSSDFMQEKNSNIHIFVIFGHVSDYSTLRQLVISQMHFFNYVQVNFVTLKDVPLNIRVLKFFSTILIYSLFFSWKQCW